MNTINMKRALEESWKKYSYYKSANHGEGVALLLAVEDQIKEFNDEIGDRYAYIEAYTLYADMDTVNDPNFDAVTPINKTWGLYTNNGYNAVKRLKWAEKLMIEKK